jgi:hypothetical protein
MHRIMIRLQLLIMSVFLTHSLSANELQIHGSILEIRDASKPHIIYSIQCASANEAQKALRLVSQNLVRVDYSRIKQTSGGYVKRGGTTYVSKFAYDTMVFYKGAGPLSLVQALWADAGRYSAAQMSAQHVEDERYQRKTAFKKDASKAAQNALLFPLAPLLNAHNND